MDARSLRFVADACEGELRRGNGDAQVTRVCTDSRRVQPHDLFFALKGERYDGHAFLRDAGEKGAAAVVAEDDAGLGSEGGCACILVANTRRALGKLAARYRTSFQLPVVAVGGSNGKTTTKDLIGAVLSEKFNVLRSEASFNNDIGVPLTLLNLESPHQAAVLEVGTNHPGELAPLVSMARPRYGVITNLGREHLEFFGDLAGVAEEEGWLAELLPPDGKLFVDGDCPAMNRVTCRTGATVVRVGLSGNHDWRARSVAMNSGGVRFTVEGSDPAFSGEYEVRLLGRHQVINALLAIAVGKELGLSRAEIQRGLARCPAPKMRLQLRQANGFQVLDDSYNANVDSMRRALETLRDLPCQGRRVAVLGDMAELGRGSAAAHAEVGEFAAQAGVDHLFAVGTMALVMGQAAREAGLKNVEEFSASETAAEALRRFIRRQDVVLLKASRASRLERIGEALQDCTVQE